MVFVVIDREAHRKRPGFLRALLREVRNEHVVAHEPRAIRSAEIAPRCLVGGVIHECGKRAATAVVITRIVQINNAVAFHVGLTGEEIDAEGFDGTRRWRRAGWHAGRRRRERQCGEHRGSESGERDGRRLAMAK